MCTTYIIISGNDIEEVIDMIKVYEVEKDQIDGDDFKNFNEAINLSLSLYHNLSLPINHVYRLVVITDGIFKGIERNKLEC